MPNLTDETGTVEQRRLNMFGSAVLASYGTDPQFRKKLSLSDTGTAALEKSTLQSFHFR